MDGDWTVYRRVNGKPEEIYVIVSDLPRRIAERVAAAIAEEYEDNVYAARD